ncbi:GMC oxidoreductase [Plantactinospora sp. CA-290183]|uniref:GMC oxidoreductase n=1 Tax=Plantactinospora sp. CA-290183 TaxID=3240006 RepID=UPI003D8B12FD
MHALGGVRPSRDTTTGVVDEAGEVHGYPGLIVMDGSVLPAATGVNPSATILAAAERSIETVIRRSGRPGWRAPEWHSISRTEVPEDAAFAFMSERHALTRGDGIVFTERMSTRGNEHPRVVMTLRAEIPGMNRFLADPAHPVSMRGVIEVEGVTSQADVTGTLSLFPQGSRVAMSYALRFHDVDGRPWQVRGVKTVRSRAPMALLAGLTNLHTEIAPADSVTGEGQRCVLSIGSRDLLRLGSSLTGTGFTRARRLRVVLRFASFFAASALRQ